MYQEFYGLSGKPFQLSPDVRFFFPSREHKRARAFLEYGLDQADGFIVITGDVGTGKTHLVQTLLERPRSSETLVSTVVTTQLEEEDLLQLAAARFGPGGPGRQQGQFCESCSMPEAAAGNGRRHCS